MNKEEITITVSNEALTQNITIQKWAINENTKDYLIERAKEFIEEILGDSNV